MQDRQPGESQVDTWQVIKSQLCPRAGGSALGQIETVSVEVYRRQTAIITGLMGRTNDATGSNYRPFWQLLTTTPASPAPGAHSNQQWPVEDIVSSQRVSSLDSLQETTVHCTQYEGFAVHGALWARVLHLLSAVENRSERIEALRDHMTSFMSCLEISLVLTEGCTFSYTFWYSSSDSSLMSVSVKTLKPSADSSDTSLRVIFPEFSSKY